MNRRPERRCTPSDRIEASAMRLMPFSQAWGDARSHAMVVNDDTAHLTPLSALGLIASRLVPTMGSWTHQQKYRAAASQNAGID